VFHYDVKYLEKLPTTSAPVVHPGTQPATTTSLATNPLMASTATTPTTIARSLAKRFGLRRFGSGENNDDLPLFDVPSSHSSVLFDSSSHTQKHQRLATKDEDEAFDHESSEESVLTESDEEEEGQKAYEQRRRERKAGAGSVRA
jgi:hypothetical protein